MPSKTESQEAKRGHVGIQAREAHASSGRIEASKSATGMPARDDAPETGQGIHLDDRERTRCEVWTRVMGYHRPVSAFNPGKQAEQAERVNFREQ